MRREMVNRTIRDGIENKELTSELAAQSTGKKSSNGGRMLNGKTFLRVALNQEGMKSREAQNKLVRPIKKNFEVTDHKIPKEDSSERTDS